MRLPVLVLLAAPVALLAPPVARAGESATACHCFTNRTFDPAKPAAADPYILATARSSVLSAAFAVPKATLVQDVMSGSDPDDLWVAFWAGARTGRDAAGLLAAKGRTGSWKGALEGSSSSRLPAAFRSALDRGAPARELAPCAVDDVLATRLAARPADLAALRAAGATSPEVILATLLAPRLRVSPGEVLARFRSGKVTWGMLLDEAGLKPKEIDPAVRKAIR